MTKELLIHWTTDNYDTSMNMVLLYAYHAKKKNLWDEITLLVWGASQNLLRDNKEIRTQVKALKEVGVKLIACQHCAEQQNTRDALFTCDIEVFFTGVFLTEWLQSKKNILTI
jgi:hypothetical protein